MSSEKTDGHTQTDRHTNTHRHTYRHTHTNTQSFAHSLRRTKTGTEISNSTSYPYLYTSLNPSDPDVKIPCMTYAYNILLRHSMLWVKALFAFANFPFTPSRFNSFVCAGVSAFVYAGVFLSVLFYLSVLVVWEESVHTPHACVHLKHKRWRSSVEK